METKNNYPFLQSGGEMGELTRNFDWSQTPLGTPDLWPQSLSTSVSVLLNSQFPMFVWWGKELTTIYNDAYKIIAGDKHPTLLGQSGREGWAEIWEDLAPLVDNVFKGNATWSEDLLLYIKRGGSMEETYFTFSYSPIFNEEGNVEGLYCAVVETTEKVISKRKLEQSEKGLRKVILQAPFATCIFRGRSFVIEVANQSMCEFWGKEPEDVMHKPLFEVIPEAKDQGFEELMLQVLETGEDFAANESTVTLFRNGVLQNVFINFTYSPIREADGTISGIIAVAIDVTEQVKARRNVEEREAYFRRLTDTVPAAIWITEKDGTCSYLNREWFELTGQTQAEALGFGWLNAAHPEDKQHTEQAFLAANNDKALFQAVYRLRLKEGNYKWIMDIGRPRYSLEGEFEGYTGFILDIHEQKQLQVSLQESQRKWQQLANVMPAFVWTAGPDGALDFLNEHWYDYTGLTEEQSLGFGWTQAIHPDDVARCLAVWENARAKEIFYEIEIRYRSSKGNFRWVVARGVPIKDDKGKVVSWYGTSSDIHEQKMLTENLEHLVAERTAELSRSNEYLESFAHAASHDMKEPLRKIRTFADRLKTTLRPKMEETEDHMFARIESAAERMQYLVDDLLEFSQVSQGGQLKESVNLNEKIQKALTDLELDIEEKNATIKIEKLPIVQGNPRQLQQLFQNLIGNALKYSKPTIAPEISVSGKLVRGANVPINLPVEQKEKSFYLIEVSDNGIGFEQQYAEQIFNMFQRLHGKSEYPGTGVGLSIARKVVENHNGYIWANSQLGKGATFYILLPMS